jgi:hypothetical protein
MEGNIQWKASYTQQGKISEYEIVFFGNVIDFFKNIGDADFKNYIAVELQDEFPIAVQMMIVEKIGEVISPTYKEARGN